MATNALDTTSTDDIKRKLALDGVPTALLNAYARAVLWRVVTSWGDRSITGRLGPIPWSIKPSRLYGWLRERIGPDPADVAAADEAAAIANAAGPATAPGGASLP